MTTDNVIGVYRGMAHWHRLVDGPRGTGWGLRLEPELKPPRGSDFALDISPPPPLGPQDFAIEVTFKRGITSHWPYFPLGRPFAFLLFAAIGCVTVSLWFPDGFAKRFLATLGLGMSLTACAIALVSARKSLGALRASDVRLREAQAHLEDVLRNPPEES